jgi:hypothetical protein
MHDLNTINTMNDTGSVPKPMDAPMHQYVIHVPRNFNDGRDIPRVSIEEFLKLALDTFGGYTINPLPVQGAYKGEDQTYIEPILQLTIASDRYAEVRKFALHIKGAFKQECVYVAKTGVVEFI